MILKKTSITYWVLLFVEKQWNTLEIKTMLYLIRLMKMLERLNGTQS